MLSPGLLLKVPAGGLNMLYRCLCLLLCFALCSAWEKWKVVWKERGAISSPGGKFCSRRKEERRKASSEKKVVVITGKFVLL